MSNDPQKILLRCQCTYLNGQREDLFKILSCAILFLNDAVNYKKLQFNDLCDNYKKNLEPTT